MKEKKHMSQQNNPECRDQHWIAYEERISLQFKKYSLKDMLAFEIGPLSIMGIGYFLSKNSGLPTQHFYWFFLFPVVTQILFTLIASRVSRKAATAWRIWWMAFDNSIKITLMGLLLLFSSLLLVRLAEVSPIWNGFLWALYGLSVAAGVFIGPKLMRWGDGQKTDNDVQKKMKVYVWAIPAAILLIGFVITSGRVNPMMYKFDLSIFLFTALTLIGFAGFRNLVEFALYLRQERNNKEG